MRVDKTYSELWSLVNHHQENEVCEVAQMAINTLDKIQEENQRYEKALKEIARWDKMLYSPREMGNFAKKAFGEPTIPFKE